MASENGVFVFPDVAKQATNGLDPNLLLALNNNGGFGNNGNWIWILFLWLIWGGNWNNGNGFGGNNGTGYLANQMSNDAGRDLLLQAINGRADAAAQLAQITNTSVNAVQSALTTIQSSIQSVGQQVGMSGLQVQNAIQAGNASLSQQLCSCCCDMKASVAEQTNALQAQMASNHSASQLQAAQNQAASQLQASQNQAALQLQNAQNNAADQLAMCQQTNTLTAQGTANTQRIVDSIANQNTMITQQFCDLRDRELQNKIDSLTADNALLRSNLNNTVQTQQFAAMLSPIQAQLNAIQSKQPQTITLPFSQYAVVPNWAATVGADFLGSYWANRATSGSTSGTTATTANA